MEPLTLIAVTPDQLRMLIANAVSEALATLRPQEQSSSTDEYLTREEAAQMLHISLPTLRNHARRGLLHPHRIGRRVLYARSDVEMALKSFG